MSISISVIGAGAFGTSLAISLANGGHQVTLYARDAVKARALMGFKEHPSLRSVKLPTNINVTHLSEDTVLDKIVIIAIPMQSLNEFCENHSVKLSDTTCIAACKGIDIASGKNAFDVLSGYVLNAGIISGPSFARDIASGLPTALTLAFRDIELARKVRGDLQFSNIRLYTTDDVVGVCLGGALKNVIAIACGVAIGAELGESARSALMTRGFKEITKYAISCGAKMDTLVGLSGLGDLSLTCMSEQSRNFTYGFQLAQGQIFHEQTVEGIHTARAIISSSDDSSGGLPVCSLVAALCEGRLDISEAVAEIMSRRLKDESLG